MKIFLLGSFFYCSAPRDAEFFWLVLSCSIPPHAEGKLLDGEVPPVTVIYRE